VIAALAALLIFAWLAGEAIRGNTMGFDLAVRGAVHSWASPVLTRAMAGVTWLGNPWFAIVLSVALGGILIRQGRSRRLAVFLIAAPAGSELLNRILKAIVHRPRPAAFFHLAQPETYSFPSGHAMCAASFYGAFAVVLIAGGAPKSTSWLGAIAAALVIGFSRVYLGVHYPTDVLAGYLAAAVWLAALLRYRSDAKDRNPMSKPRV